MQAVVNRHDFYQQLKRAAAQVANGFENLLFQSVDVNLTNNSFRVHKGHISTRVYVRNDDLNGFTERVRRIQGFRFLRGFYQEPNAEGAEGFFDTALFKKAGVKLAFDMVQERLSLLGYWIKDVSDKSLYPSTWAIQVTVKQTLYREVVGIVRPPAADEFPPLSTDAAIGDTSALEDAGLPDGSSEETEEHTERPVVDLSETVTEEDLVDLNTPDSPAS